MASNNRHDSQRPRRHRQSRQADGNIDPVSNGDNYYYNYEMHPQQHCSSTSGAAYDPHTNQNIPRDNSATQSSNIHNHGGYNHASASRPVVVYHQRDASTPQHSQQQQDYYSPQGVYDQTQAQSERSNTAAPVDINDINRFLEPYGRNSGQDPGYFTGLEWNQEWRREQQEAQQQQQQQQQQQRQRQQQAGHVRVVARGEVPQEFLEASGQFTTLSAEALQRMQDEQYRSNQHRDGHSHGRRRYGKR